MGAAELSHGGDQERQHDPDRSLKAGVRAYAVFFHCQTNLVETFRELYPRAELWRQPRILLDAEKKVPEAELRHCVALALTYHLRKRKGAGARYLPPSLRGA